MTDAKNGATTRAQRGTFLHHEHEKTKRFSSGVAFADIVISYFWQHWNMPPAAGTDTPISSISINCCAFLRTKCHRRLPR